MNIFNEEHLVRERTLLTNVDEGRSCDDDEQ
ncbi:unnamed protein product [Cylicostephanus goldi]|uniref:Uncharacterized protein n=1 Tax=Cylicostephanus goldi TaxID=71465 RepID=A0A3P6RNP9_CYLGO|nr:unnamed protein product [Cylicostephanus goldi]